MKKKSFVMGCRTPVQTFPYVYACVSCMYFIFSKRCFLYYCQKLDLHQATVRDIYELWHYQFNSLLLLENTSAL